MEKLPRMLQKITTNFPREFAFRRIAKLVGGAVREREREVGAGLSSGLLLQLTKSQTLSAFHKAAAAAAACSVCGTG